MVHSIRGLPPYKTLKSLPDLYAPPSPINMTTVIRQHTKFPPTATSPRQSCSPGYSLPHG